MSIQRNLAAGILALATTVAGAQMLARPGWSGSGMNTDPWWKHAVFATADDTATIPAITAQLNDLQTLGVDALVLSPASVAELQSGSAAFDTLIHEAGRRGIRVLVPLTATPVVPSADAMRLWLNSGVSGFRIDGLATIPAAQIQAYLAQMRRVTDAAVGQRILIAEPPAAGIPALAPFYARNELQMPILDLLSPSAAFDAATLRTRLSEAQSKLNGNLPLLTLDAAHAPGMARIADTIVLATRSVTLLSSIPRHTQIPGIAVTAEGDDLTSLFAWDHKLIALRHSSDALRSGTQILLNHDAQNALVWIRKPANASLEHPAVVIACNFSAQPVTLSLKADMKSNGIRGSFLRTIARTDHGMGPMDLDALHLPPYGVYIGEVRY